MNRDGPRPYYMPSQDRLLKALLDMECTAEACFRLHEKILREKLIQEPENIPVRLRLGVLYREWGRHEKSLRHLKLCLESEYGDAGAVCFEMACTLKEMGRFERARKLLEPYRSENGFSELYEFFMKNLESNDGP